ncbi:hypothetical protein [Pseudanabaena sp. PCC 6802]|uniref:DUF7219 family protein n=1 Tax=Pseudanabaena sp. PCC 6802 TaxID=118173 RepID=UPI00034D43E9|nr:hypothetical protein [Pseudanabaena sp. PCC 6802]
MSKMSEFLNPYHRFYGEFTPENLMFDANLQEFAHRVGIISALEKGGKMSPKESFEQIESLWQKLKLSKHQLGIGNSRS